MSIFPLSDKMIDGLFGKITEILYENHEGNHQVMK